MDAARSFARVLQRVIGPGLDTGEVSDYAVSYTSGYHADGVRAPRRAALAGAEPSLFAARAVDS
jgi:hypothetical protein